MTDGLVCGIGGLSDGVSAMMEMMVAMELMVAMWSGGNGDGGDVHGGDGGGGDGECVLETGVFV